MPTLFNSGVFKKKTSSKTREDSQTLRHKSNKSSSVGVDGKEIIHPLQYLVGSGQSVGLQREHNEDALYTFTSALSDGKSEELFGLFIIADGMGGHRNGEVASSVSIRVVARYIVDQLYSILLDPQHGSLSVGIQEILASAINEAQKAVLQYAPGGGTTITIALLLGEQVTVSHVGDSRAYFVLPEKTLKRITKDHSLVQHMLDLKQITESEAEVHPQKNVLLRAIGQPDPYLPDTQTLQILPGAQLMLCSDGLWGVVTEKEMLEITSSEKDPIIACQKLVKAANKIGGPDNISVILVRIAGEK